MQKPKPQLTYTVPAKGVTKCPPALAAGNTASEALKQHVATKRKEWLAANVKQEA
jgi:hypothetical protein